MCSEGDFVFKTENSDFSVNILEMGAELCSLKSKKSGKEYIWGGNPEIWHGHSPVLFPIVGTLLNNKYRFDGKEYELFRHGCARKREFQLKEQGESYIILTQSYNDESLKQYPFKYIFDIKFSLDGNTLTVTHTIKNADDKAMYFSLGCHPGFNCKIGDFLEFEKEENPQDEMIDEDSILIDKIFPSPVEGKNFYITKDIFDKDAHILSGLKSKKVTLKSNKTPQEVEFTFGDAPYLGLWAKPGADYVCIEPWFGINDDRNKKADISQKRDILSLDPDKEFNYSWSAKIKE